MALSFYSLVQNVQPLNESELVSRDHGAFKPEEENKKCVTRWFDFRMLSRARLDRRVATCLAANYDDTKNFGNLGRAIKLTGAVFATSYCSLSSHKTRLIQGSVSIYTRVHKILNKAHLSFQTESSTTHGHTIKTHHAIGYFLRCTPNYRMQQHGAVRLVSEEQAR